MKLLYKLVLILAFCSCKNSEKQELKGTWNFLGITTSDSITYDNQGVVPLMWLSVLAEKTKISFSTDSVTINDTIRKDYKIQNDRLYVGEEEADFTINNDTLKLISLPEKDVIVLFIRDKEQ